MTSVTNTSALDSLSRASIATKTSSGLDQNAFLKLMTTQLKTQDPFNPVDNAQMVAQMAQFSSVAGIAEMNTSLKGISETLSATRLGDAASWIGRSALVSSDVTPQLPDGSYAGEISFPSNATDATLSLVDAKGQVVHSEALGAQAAGTLRFGWNGKDADGNAVASGPLKIVVSARNSTGDVAATTTAWTPIAGVQSPAGGSATQLVTSLGLISPDQALRLS